ncbi:hypothetical protein [Neptunitalea chrysea]|nr:hypothetical protein [Neptunitalea chrysea]
MNTIYKLLLGLFVAGFFALINGILIKYNHYQEATSVITFGVLLQIISLVGFLCYTVFNNRHKTS